MQVKSIAECSPSILSTFIKLPFVIKIFVLSIFELPLKTGFTILLQAGSQKKILIFQSKYNEIVIIIISVSLTCVLGYSDEPSHLIETFHLSTV